MKTSACANSPMRLRPCLRSFVGRPALVLLWGIGVALPARASIEKLQATQVPVLALLLDAFESEGETFNLANETGTLPAFHSARWNSAAQTLDWRFWVPAEGALYESLQPLPRSKAVVQLKAQMENLAVFVGLNPMPGFDKPMGALDTAQVSGRHLLSDADWLLARQQLAAASVIHLAAPHKEGPILLVRRPDGRMVEEPVSMPPPATGHSE